MFFLFFLWFMAVTKSLMLAVYKCGGELINVARAKSISKLPHSPLSPSSALAHGSHAAPT